MFKRIVKYFLLLLFLALSAYFVFCLVSNYDVEQALPEKPIAVVSVNKPKKILYEYSYLFKNRAEVQSFKKFFPFIPNFKTLIAKISNRPILIIDAGYLRGVLSIGFTFRKYFQDKENGFYLEAHPALQKKDKDLYVIKKGNLAYGFLAKKRNLLLVSPTTKPLLLALENLKTGKKHFSIDRKRDISIFFQSKLLLNDLFKSFPQLTKIKPFLENNELGTAFFSFNDKYIRIEAKLKFSETTKSEKEEALKRMLSISSGDRTLTDTIPSRVSSAVSFSVNSFEDLYNLMNLFFRDDADVYKMLQYGSRGVKYVTKKGINDLIFEWLGEEISAVVLSNARKPILVMRIKDPDSFQKGFKPLIGDLVKKVGFHEIYRVELPGYFQLLKSIFAPSIKLPHFCLYNKRTLLIANSWYEIAEFLKAGRESLSKNPYYKKIQDKLSGTPQITFYSDLKRQVLPFFYSNPMMKSILTKYRKIGGGIHLNYPEVKLELIILKE